MGHLYQSAQQAEHLEQFAYGTTVLHKAHAGVKLFLTGCFVVVVVSFPRYTVSGLLPYFLFPIVLMWMAGIPYKVLLGRVKVALPFALLGGMSNLILERQVAQMVGDLPLTYGMLSFCSILMKTTLSVMAVLILVGTTSLPEISHALSAVGIPDSFVLQLVLTYRYVTVLLEEAGNLYTAYVLRSTQKRGIAFVHMGTFLGQLLLRSIERGQRVYHAMECRGFDGTFSLPGTRHCSVSQLLIAAGLLGMFLFLRVVNGSLWIGQWINEMGGLG